jgi:hypothetical protein
MGASDAGGCVSREGQMSHRTLAAVVTAIAFGCLAPVAVLAQNQGVADSGSTAVRRQLHHLNRQARADVR